MILRFLQRRAPPRAPRRQSVGGDRPHAHIYAEIDVTDILSILSVFQHWCMYCSWRCDGKHRTGRPRSWLRRSPVLGLIELSGDDDTSSFSSATIRWGADQFLLVEFLTGTAGAGRRRARTIDSADDLHRRVQ